MDAGVIGAYAAAYSMKANAYSTIVIVGSLVFGFSVTTAVDPVDSNVERDAQIMQLQAFLLTATACFSFVAIVIGALSVYHISHLASETMLMLLQSRAVDGPFKPTDAYIDAFKSIRVYARYSLGVSLITGLSAACVRFARNTEYKALYIGVPVFTGIIALTTIVIVIVMLQRCTQENSIIDTQFRQICQFTQPRSAVTGTCPLRSHNERRSPVSDSSLPNCGTEYQQGAEHRVGEQTLRTDDLPPQEIRPHPSQASREQLQADRPQSPMPGGSETQDLEGNIQSRVVITPSPQQGLPAIDQARAASDSHRRVDIVVLQQAGDSANTGAAAQLQVASD